MRKRMHGCLAFASLLLLAVSPVRACGEAAFNAAKGLPYQGYLAERPATVLIYSQPGASGNETDRQALYAGLTRAGHKLTVVGDGDGLANALREHHYDVVIAPSDAVDAVTAATADAGGSANSPRLLPVFAPHDRNSTQLRERFGAFLLDGASLRQYLKMIGKALQDTAP